MMLGILCLVLAYIAGSFPSGLVIGKALYHTDIRDYGSHNTGATNAYRVFGAVGGLLVLQRLLVGRKVLFISAPGPQVADIGAHHGRVQKHTTPGQHAPFHNEGPRCRLA